MLLDNIQVQTRGELEKLIDMVALNQIHAALNLEKPVIYCFVNDEELLKVNINMLGHDYYTDIITFDYKDDDIEEDEIMISYERVIENSKTYNVKLSEELHRVCIHGLLHIAGFRDKTNEEKKEMRMKENYYLKNYCST